MLSNPQAHGLTTDIEQIYWDQGFSTIVGIDEVGRGSLAGPIVAAAVCFAQNHNPIAGIDDSKKLSSKNRKYINDLILNRAMFVKIQTVSVKSINSTGIARANRQVIIDCISACDSPDVLLIDGNWKPESRTIVQSLIKGDQQCYSIAAASIVAKVFRDELMDSLHQDFPEYNWSQNKGYGTLKHRQAIKSIGPSPHHRNLFIRKIASQTDLKNLVG